MTCPIAGPLEGRSEPQVGYPAYLPPGRYQGSVGSEALFSCGAVKDLLTGRVI